MLKRADIQATFVLVNHTGVLLTGESPIVEPETETHSYEDLIACPWCGETADSDLWEHGWTGVEDEKIERECGSCGKPICISRHMSVSYTARRS